jgi:hypothetical protein
LPGNGTSAACHALHSLQPLGSRQVFDVAEQRLDRLATLIQGAQGQTSPWRLQ